MRGDTVYAGGFFSSVGGQARSNLAAIDRVSGSLLPWNPAPNGLVNTITADDTTVYVGGDRVLHGGSLWQARWWTQGETPSSAAWGPWQHVALC